MSHCKGDDDFTLDDERGIAKIAFKTGDHAEIAQQLIERLERRGRVISENGRLYQYSTIGVWNRVEQSALSRIVQSFSGRPVVKRIDARTGTPILGKLSIRATDVAGSIKLAIDRVEEREFFAKGRPGLAFRNCFVTVDREGGLSILPHSPEHRANLFIDATYDSDAQCPAFERFLASLFDGDVDQNEKIRFLQGYLGAALFGLATRFQKCAVLVGEGSNGKGTLSECILACFPSAIRASVEPEAWSIPHEVAALDGVRLNVIGELPSSHFGDSRKLKGILAGDEMSACRKWENPFSFRPIAAHLFSCNALPTVSDMSHGFWRRFVIIAFNKKFEGEQVVAGLAQQLIDKESTGILAWLIRGAERVVRENRLDEPASSLQAKSAWRSENDSVTTYVGDQLVRDAEGEGTKGARLYASYNKWCSEGTGDEPVTYKVFCKRLREHRHLFDDGSKHHRKDGTYYPLKHRFEGTADFS